MTGANSSRTAELRPQLGAGQGDQERRAIEWIRQLLGVAISVVALLFQSADASIQTEAVILVAALIGAALVSWRPDRGVGGAAFLYVVVFGLFHAGLVVAVAVGGERFLIGRGANAWAVSDAVPAAVTAVVIAILALECGILLTRLRRTGPIGEPELDQAPRTDLVGYAGVVIGLALIASALQSVGGLGALFSGYLEFLEKVASDGAFGYGVAILGCGIGFLVASGGRARSAGWLVVAVVAAVGLPLGLRGTVLFLVVTVLVVEAKRTRISAWLFVLGSVAVLALVSILRTSRVGGIGALVSGGAGGAAPLEAVAEMGYSLYPVVVVQEWLEGGLEYRYGVSFVAPILRFIEASTGANPGPAATDYRIFNVEVLSLVGPIGGSPVAEALRNGGMLGVCVLMVALGFAVGWVDRLPATPNGGAITVVVLLPLMIAIRNSFAPVLVQIAIGLAMLATAGLLGRLSQEHRPR